MTIHCVINYFDTASKSSGYLLGSDSAAIAKPSEVITSIDDSIKFQVDKSFRGKNTIGFIRGSLTSNTKNFSMDCLDQIKSLDNQFDEITHGREYSTLPLSGSNYVMVIGKKNDRSLELYTLSNMRDKEVNKAILMHNLTPETFYTAKETTVWYSPFTKDYLVFNMKKRLNFSEAKNHIKELLTSTEEIAIILGIDNHISSQPNIFVLNFEGIHKIDIN